MEGYSNSDALSKIVLVFIKRGAERIVGSKVAFRWVREVNGVRFSLLIEGVDTSFQYLPIVRLEERPLGLPSKLPHVLGADNVLCYLDSEQVYLDPFSPEICAHQILDAVEQTLLILSTPESRDRDFAHDFSIFWGGEWPGYLLSENGEVQASLIADSELNKMCEYIFFSREEERAKWSEARDMNVFISTLPVITATLKQPPSINIGINWPPKSLKDILKWLRVDHPDVEAYLLERLTITIHQSLTAFVLFENEVSGPFGFKVAFNNIIKKVIPKDTHRNKKVRRFRSVFESSKYQVEFSRIYIEDVTENFVLNRNIEGSSFRNKRIAILGCGTVGGYLADSMVKAGAGSGKEGVLALYDRELLKSSNIGRHVLGYEHIGYRKDYSLAKSLKESTLHEIRVEPRGHAAANEDSGVYDFDLIIDATGRQQFSTWLSYISSKVRQGGKSVNMLHVWVDANGKAVRCLLDDGRGGCYRCLKVEDSGSKRSSDTKERFELFSAGNEQTEPGYSYRCGESYIPFSGSISLIASGVAHQIGLELFAGDPSPRFRHISLSKNIKFTKSQNISKIKSCPCCSRSKKNQFNSVKES